MNILTDDLPMSVTVAGEEYSIATDYRDWIRFEQMLGDNTLSHQDKAMIALSFFDSAIPTDMGDAIDALIAFYSRVALAEQEPSRVAGQKRNDVRLLDYAHDAALLYGGFLQAYKIDLLKCEYLHWWAFCALIEALPAETKIAEYMGYRSIDPKKIKVKAERERIEAIKKAIDLPRNRTAYKTLQERDEAYLERHKRRATEIAREREANKIG